MGLFGRAHAGLNLSPAERALLRLLEGIAAAALVAGIQAVMPLLNAQSVAAIDWMAVLHTFLAAALVAGALSLLKFATAQGDAPLPAPGATGVMGSAPPPAVTSGV